MEKVTIVQSYSGVILLVFSVLILIEIIWSLRANKKAYEWKETLINLFILVGFFISKILLTGYQLTIMAEAGKFALISLEDNWLTFSIVFLLVDFTYYWYHRLSHKWEPLWAFHSVHHSSKQINLTAGYRLNWLSGLITPFFFVPLAFLGFSPQTIAVSFGLNLLYQFFLHTEMVGKLGILEGVLDTPSSHRVHHGLNEKYLDKNFGGVFMFWDRLFGTYQVEQEKVIYGELNGTESNNPFVLLFHRFILLFRKMKFQIKAWLFLLLLSFGMANISLGQTTSSYWEQLSPEKRGILLTELMQQELGLDSVQKSKVLVINKHYAVLLDEVWKSDETTSVKKQKGLELQEARERKFADVLSKKQLEIYRRKKAEYVDQLKEIYDKED